MHVVCRWLLISLLIMALPLKGLAAAGYLGCGALHAQSTAHAHPAGAHEAHSHGGPADLQGDVANAGAVPDQKPDPSASKTGLKCTQCAPCCGAAAPPGDAPLLLGLAGASDPKAAVRLLELGGDVGRLDRPPQSSLV